ncbi:MAG TPA: hypothetical protein VK735_10925 [Pseudonocardia sp.]|nr:hypothetical protein [Pseudonocardia sp.]HTF47953.1 hypothetical protein [Pseudonocardia sp.]
MLLSTVLGLVLDAVPPRSAVGAVEPAELVAAVCTPLFSDSVP